MGMVHWYTWHILTLTASWDLRRVAPQAVGSLRPSGAVCTPGHWSSRGGSVEEFPPWSHFDTSMVSTTWVTKKSNSWLGPILVIWSLWHAFPMFPYKKIGIPWARTGGMVSLGPGHLPLPRSQTSLCRQGQGRAGYGGWCVCLSAKSQVFFKLCHKPAIKPAISLN